MWGAHDGMGWWMLFGMIWMVVFWGLIIAIIVWAISRFSGGGTSATDPRARPAGPPEESAIEIAKKRYARGDIERDEFERLRQDLG